MNKTTHSFLCEFLSEIKKRLFIESRKIYLMSNGCTIKRPFVDLTCKHFSNSKIRLTYESYLN